MPPTVGWGDGQGNFNCGIPYPDALLVSGQVRDMKILRTANGRTPLLILARNEDSLVFLKY
jgi:hypothetical protein